MKLKIEVAFAHSRISRQSCAFLVEGKTNISITTVSVHGLLVCYKNVMQVIVVLRYVYQYSEVN